VVDWATEAQQLGFSQGFARRRASDGGSHQGAVAQGTGDARSEGRKARQDRHPDNVATRMLAPRQPVAATWPLARRGVGNNDNNDAALTAQGRGDGTR